MTTRPQFLLSLLGLACLNSCGTTLYRDGQPIMMTFSDLQNVRYDDGTTTFSADILDNSTPSLAAGQSAGIVAGAVSPLILLP
jgi:hypothetical protein